MGFFNSRRKQSTPTKKPTLPGEPSTVLITHAGQPPPPDSPVEDIFQFPQDLGPPNSDHNTNLPATSSLRAVRKQSLKKADVVVPQKYDFDPKILQFNSNEAESEIKNNPQEVQPNSGPPQGTEGDFADKESDDENLSLKAVIRKKRASKFAGNLEESDSELDSKNKPTTKKGRGRPKSQNPKTKSPTFAIPKSSPRTSKKNGNYSTESELEGTDGSKIGGQRRSSNEDTPQRRRSKGEMKEFPTPAEKAAKAELFQKLEEDLEAMFEEKKDSKGGTDDPKGQTEDPKGDTDDPKDHVFQKVEDDLEAMFAGLDDNGDDIPETKPTPGAVKRKSKVKAEPRKSKGESKVKPDSEKKKRGRKPKVKNDSESDNFDYDPDDVHEPTYRPELPARSKSKRKSAQNAELRFRESNSDDEDFLLKRYFKNEEKKQDLPNTDTDNIAKPENDEKAIETEKEKEPIENEEASKTLPAIIEENPKIEESDKAEEITKVEENTKIEQLADNNAEVQEISKVEEEIQILNDDDKPINLAVTNMESMPAVEINKPETTLEQTKEEPKPEVVLETSVIRPKKLTRAMQESMMEMNKLKNENMQNSLQNPNSPIIIDDSKPEIIEITPCETSSPTPPPTREKSVVELDSSNQEDEAENLSLAERRGRKKQPRKSLKKEVKPVETPIDLSIPEKEHIEETKPIEVPIKADEKPKNKKGRRSQKAKEEEIKPEEELKEHISIVEECKDEQKAESELIESPVTERRTRRSNGKVDELKGKTDMERKEDAAPNKQEAKQEEDSKTDSMKTEQANQEEIVVDTRRRKLRRSNDDLDKSKEAEDLSMKKEIEVVGTRSGRKGRKTRVSEEKVAKMEKSPTLDDKANVSIEETNDIPKCDESLKENLHEKDEIQESAKIESPSQSGSETNKVEEEKTEIIPRGRQMGRRSRPLRKTEPVTDNKSSEDNHPETPDKVENDEQSPEKLILPKTKKLDIKLKKVDIRTKEGLNIPATFDIKKPENTSVPVNGTKNQNTPVKKDSKESPPISRRSRRSKDPNADNSLEVEKPSDDNSPAEPSEEKQDDSLNNEKPDEKRQPARRGRKRPLSASDSNASLPVETDDLKSSKKAKLGSAETQRPSRRTRGPRSDESLNSTGTDKSHENEDKVEENETLDIPTDESLSGANGKPEEGAPTTKEKNKNTDNVDKTSEMQEVIDVTDDDEVTRVDDTDEISILEIEDSNDVNSDSINELLDSAEASNIESNDTSPVRKKKRGPKPGSKNKPRKPKIQDENLDMSKQLKKALKKGKKYTDVEVLLERFKGPFVHIEGSFRSPNFVNVVNSSNDTLGPKTISQRGICDQELRPKLTNFGHSSALSKQYDSRNIDQTWVCVFCQKTSHFHGLGDLFGPYWVPAEKVKTPQKVRKDSQNSESSKKGGRKRRKSEISEISVDAAPTDDNGKTEIWFHEDCFIWIPNTFLVGGRIVGLEDGVEQCQELNCSECHNRGASVGCTAHGCKEAAHVYCAEQAKWHLDMHNFDAKCKNHAD